MEKLVVMKMVKEKINTIFNKRIIVCVIIAILVVVAICSPGFMLRAAVFTVSPKSAFSMVYKADENEKDGRIYKIIGNAPVEKSTQDMLTTWKVYHIGPFCFAKYYGEE